jgi:IPT/TIG domain
MFDFPDTPTIGDVYAPLPGVTYTFNGTGWSYVSGNATLSISVLIPAYFIVGGADLPMRVTGIGFVPSTIIFFDGVAVPTQYGDGTELRTLVRASAEAAPRVVQVTVRTGAVESNALPLNFIEDPTITTLAPDSISVSGAPVTVTVTGTGFIADTIAVLNDVVELVTTFVSTTELTAVVEPTMGGAGDSLYFKVMTGTVSSNTTFFDFTA